MPQTGRKSNSFLWKLGKEKMYVGMILSQNYMQWYPFHHIFIILEKNRPEFLQIIQSKVHK